jgi:RNA polymerase sigma-70 factor, ECF subfamily
LDRTRQNGLYNEAIAEFGGALRRLARGYEADQEKQQDLLQEIHLELWLSLENFDQRCSLRTWVYRIAHNVAADHIVRNRRISARLVDLETVGEPTDGNWRIDADQRLSVTMLLDLVHRLKPLDRQVVLLYLEGETAASIGETTGLTARNVATKMHRIKKLLRQWQTEGVCNEAERT